METGLQLVIKEVTIVLLGINEIKKTNPLAQKQTQFYSNSDSQLCWIAFAFLFTIAFANRARKNWPSDCLKF
jgi:hypothetical protein